MKDKLISEVKLHVQAKQNKALIHCFPLADRCSEACHEACHEAGTCNGHLGRQRM